MCKFFTCFSGFLFIGFILCAQDYPYPLQPSNTATVSNSTPTLQWKGSTAFSSYTVQIYECSYSTNNNFNSIHLEEYELIDVKDGPTGYEASALTINENMPGDFFTVDDEGTEIISYSNNFNSSQEFPIQQYSGNDYEGLTYLYDNYFVMVEERLDLLFFLKMNYSASGNLTSITEIVNRSTNNPYISGANNGYEGITYNPVENKIYLIKEYSPLKFFEFAAPTPGNFNEAINITEPFDLENVNWTPDDVAGLYHLSLNKALSATPAGKHLLLLSQENETIYEIDLNGNVISQKVLDTNDVIANYSEGFFQAEGITYNNGKIWIASEGFSNKTAKFYVFENNNHSNPTSNLSSTILTQNNITTTQWQVPECILKPNKNYCWKVIAHSNDGSIAVSEIFNFYTQFQNEDCGVICPYNIYHYINTQLADSYYAENKLISNSSTNNGTGLLRYYAGNRITLNKGFHADERFSAYIEDCP